VFKGTFYLTEEIRIKKKKRKKEKRKEEKKTAEISNFVLTCPFDHNLNLENDSCEW